MRASFVIGTLGCLLGLGACASDVGGCRSQDECGDTESCVPPGAPRACGIPCQVDRACEADSDCDTGQVCEEYVATCCFAGELSARCVPACADDAGCLEGERCDTTSGQCGLVPCDDGYACPAHTTCSSGAAGIAGHGCVRDACGGDGDCGDGACVDGRCYEAAGTCEGPVP